MSVAACMELWTEASSAGWKVPASSPSGLHRLRVPWRVSGWVRKGKMLSLGSAGTSVRQLQPAPRFTAAPCRGFVRWELCVPFTVFLFTSAVRGRMRGSCGRQIYFTKLKINRSPLLSCSLPSTPTWQEHLLRLSVSDWRVIFPRDVACVTWHRPVRRWLPAALGCRQLLRLRGWHSRWWAVPTGGKCHRETRCLLPSLHPLKQGALLLPQIEARPLSWWPLGWGLPILFLLWGHSFIPSKESVRFLPGGSPLRKQTGAGAIVLGYITHRFSLCRGAGLEGGVDHLWWAESYSNALKLRLCFYLLINTNLGLGA